MILSKTKILHIVLYENKAAFARFDYEDYNIIYKNGVKSFSQKVQIVSKIICNWRCQ